MIAVAHFHLPISDRESLPWLSISFVIFSFISWILFISTTISLPNLPSLFPRNRIIYASISFYSLLLLLFFHKYVHHCSCWVHPLDCCNFIFHWLQYCEQIILVDTRWSGVDDARYHCTSKYGITLGKQMTPVESNSTFDWIMLPLISILNGRMIQSTREAWN